MKVRWFRLGVLAGDEGAPETTTFHVRARSERSARALVAARLPGRRHFVYACVPGDPLARAAPDEMVAAEYGPYRRSPSDPAVAALLRAARAAAGTPGGG